ncbi:MAG: ABC transporter ATP-binding protein [Candidatus Omnitrophica bacterium]|nr:ABC transporter ATP-binding protein [Candidatus Omnitrophota bacterium]
MKKYKILLFFLKKHYKIYSLVLLLTIVHGVFASFNIALFAPVLGAFMSSDAQAPGGWLMDILQNMVRIVPFKDQVISAVSLILAITVLKCLITIWRDWISGYAGAKVLADVKDSIIEQYSNAPYQFYLDSKQGELYYNLHTAPERVFTYLILYPNILTAFFNILFFLIVLFGISAPATIMLLAVLVVFHFFISFISNRISYPLGKQRKDILTSQQVVGTEFINGIKQISIFLAKKKWLSHFKELNVAFRKVYVRFAVWVSVPRNFIEMIMFFFVAVSLVYLRNKNPLFLEKNFSSIAVYIASLQMLLLNLFNLTKLRMRATNILADVATCHDTLSSGLKGMKKPADGSIHLDNFNKGIRFEKVSFFYGGDKEEAVLNNADFFIEKSKTTALIGVSGSGKTTVVNLILRLYSPKSGRIFIDDIDLEDCRIESWLSKIGFVSQDSFIFHSSIKDNICFGNSNYTDEQVIEAASLANAHEFISEFPKGYDTVVGEKGMKLSGGQQQRIAIARALIKKPQVLILDEATSSLDNISEKAIQSSIDNISGKCTVLIIAHRLSTIVGADKIIVFKDSQVSEEGNHKELIESKGYYWHLYNMQEPLAEDSLKF